MLKMIKISTKSLKRIIATFQKFYVINNKICYHNNVVPKMYARLIQVVTIRKFIYIFIYFNSLR